MKMIIILDDAGVIYYNVKKLLNYLLLIFWQISLLINHF